ncbi:MAG: hypothetical protein GY952_12195 [Rhodobacteraceae bacterium]|nr:hypothetical protein [Paracoccaceae bacterium]
MFRGVVLILALLANPLAAQEVTPVSSDRVDAFWQVIASNGCRMTQDAAEQASTAAGFDDQTEARGIFAQLLFDGRARIQEGQLQVFGAPCEYAPSPDFTLVIQELLAAYGCELLAEESRQALKDWDIHPGELKAVLPLMVAAGMVSLKDNDKVIYIPLKQCEEIGVPIGDQRIDVVVTQESTSPDASVREQVIAFFAERGCALPHDVAKPAMIAEGFEWRAVEDAVMEMIGRGEAIVTGTDEMLTLKTGACA